MVPLAVAGAPPAVSYNRYRVTVSATSLAAGSFRLYVAEIGLTVAATGLAASMAGTYTATSTFGGAFAPSSAFDGILTTSWVPVADAPFPQTITVQLTTPVAASFMTIKSADTSGRAQGAPKTFVIQGSTDGVTWVTLSTQTDLAPWGINEARSFALTP